MIYLWVKYVGYLISAVRVDCSAPVWPGLGLSMSTGLATATSLQSQTGILLVNDQSCRLPPSQYSVFTPHTPAWLVGCNSGQSVHWKCLICFHIIDFIVLVWKSSAKWLLVFCFITIIPLTFLYVGKQNWLHLKILKSLALLLLVWEVQCSSGGWDECFRDGEETQLHLFKTYNWLMWQKLTRSPFSLSLLLLSSPWWCLWLRSVCCLRRHPRVTQAPILIILIGDHQSLISIATIILAITRNLGVWGKR